MTTGFSVEYGKRSAAAGTGKSRAKTKRTPKPRAPRAVAEKAPKPPKPAPIVRSKTPLVLIDDRAGSKQLIEHPPLNDGCGQWTRLTAGDAMVIGHEGSVIGVEVKSLADFLQSLDTGRLQAHQIPEMHKVYDVLWLLVYGRYRGTPYGELEIFNARTGQWVTQTMGSRVVPYGYVEQSMLSILAHGVYVKTVDSYEQAAQWIGALARWWAKPLSEHKTFKKFNNAGGVTTTGIVPELDPRLKICAEIASRLPGIGYERAVAAAQVFPSIAAMMTATEEQWMEIPGIGKGIAKSLVDTITRRRSG